MQKIIIIIIIILYCNNNTVQKLNDFLEILFIIRIQCEIWLGHQFKTCDWSQSLSSKLIIG